MSSDNYCLKFNMCEVNAVGKTARGVKSMNLNDNQYIVDALVIAPEVDYIKISRYNIRNKDIVLQKRAGKGKKIG